MKGHAARPITYKRHGSKYRIRTNKRSLTRPSVRVKIDKLLATKELAEALCQELNKRHGWINSKEKLEVYEKEIVKIPKKTRSIGTQTDESDLKEREIQKDQTPESKNQIPESKNLDLKSNIEENMLNVFKVPALPETRTYQSENGIFEQDTQNPNYTNDYLDIVRSDAGSLEWDDEYLDSPTLTKIQEGTPDDLYADDATAKGA